MTYNNKVDAFTAFIELGSTLDSIFRPLTDCLNGFILWFSASEVTLYAFGIFYAIIWYI